MGQLLQAVESEEAAGALDGVDRPEDTRQHFPRPWVLLQGEQVTVELVEVLVGLHQELGDDLVDRFHPVLLLAAKALLVVHMPAGHGRTA